MTSTYLAPFLAFLAAPGFLGPTAAPSKSSMLLELLRLVGGRDSPAAPWPSGGALAVLVLDADRSMATGPGGGGPLSEGPRLAARGGGGAPPAAGGGGALARPPASVDDEGGEAGLALTERGAALGGGGVAFLAVSSGPAFLLTQRLSSGS